MQQWLSHAGRTHALAVLAIAAVLNCAEEVAPETQVASTPATQSALLTVVYGESAAPGLLEQPIVIDGFFARHSGFDFDDVLYAVNLPDTPDRYAPQLNESACEVVIQKLGEPLSSTDDRPYIELMDVGEIRVQLGRSPHRLTRRSFPDLFADVMGITYEAVLMDSGPELQRIPLFLQSMGSDQVGPFTVHIAAPSVPRLVEIGTQPIDGTYAAMDWDEDVRIRWTAPTDENDIVFVELSVVDLDRMTALRCAVPDSGTMVLPQAGVHELAKQLTPSSTVRLITRRIRQQDFQANGLHSGTVLFIARDSVLLQ